MHAFPESPTDKIVYFVRHGQSEANALPIFQGPDSPLDEIGKQQAAIIAERVSRVPFEALISSSFPRAKETAQAIGKMTGKQPEYSDLFVERIKPSSINGKPYADEHANLVWRALKKNPAGVCRCIMITLI